MWRPRRLWCALGALFCLCLPAQVICQEQLTEQVNLQGQVLERGTRAPLEGVEVVAWREGAGAWSAQTDEEGRFVFFGLAEGWWALGIEEEGYLLYQTREEVRGGQVAQVVYYLEATSESAQDVIIEGQRERKEVTSYRLQIKEAEGQPGSLGDPVGAVSNLPGVARAGFGSGLIIARGSAPEDTRILIEGFDIPLFFHFGGLRSVLPAPMLAGLTFTPGNYSAAYGRATGGVLEVDIAHLAPEAVHGYADVNAFDAGFYVEAPLGERAAVAVAGRRSYIDAVLNDLLGDDAGFNFFAAPRYYDGQVLLSWRPHRDHELRLLALWVDDHIGFEVENLKGDNPLAQSNSFDIHIRSRQVALYHDARLGEDFHSKLRVGLADFAQESEAAGTQTDVTLLEPFVIQTSRWEVAPWLTLRAGGDARWSRGTARGALGDLPREEDAIEEPPLENLRALDIEDSFVSGGVFVEGTARPTEALSVTPGLRGDLQQWSQAPTLDLRLSARYLALEALTLKGAVGSFHQGPLIEERLDPLGNPEIEPERAIHYSAGFEWSPHPTTSLNLTGFYKDLDHLIVRTDAAEVRDGVVTPLRFDNSGRGRSYGAELLLRQEPLHGLSGWLSYTLSRSERWDAARGAWRPFDYDQTHILTLVGSYALPWRMALGLRWRFVTGNPETPVTGAVYDADQDIWRPLFGAPNSGRQGAFHQLDLRLDKTWVFDTWRLTTYLDVQNAYNRANPEGTAWNHNYTEQKTISGLPLIPALGLRGEF